LSGIREYCLDPRRRFGNVALHPDASVAPSIMSGPGTNAVAYMIGGRAAEFIKAEM
jgi:hypothetical protein